MPLVLFQKKGHEVVTVGETFNAEAKILLKILEELRSCQILKDVRPLLEEGEGSCLVKVFPEGVMEEREKLAGLENEGERLLDWQDVLQVLHL